MINIIINKLLKTFLILLISLLFIELTAKISIKLGLLDKGLPPWVTLRAHQDFGNWHPKNITLNLEKKNCWISTVSYNSLGMRKTSDENLKYNNTKKKIALLGDSMIENIEVSDGLDLGSSIQKKLNNYKVYNYSARGTGLADQLEIYKKLIKPNNFEYLFLFLTANDIDNNVYGHTSIHHTRFDIKDSKIVKIPKDKKFFEQYNSKINIIRRDFFLLFKKLDLYKVYLKMYYFLVIQKRDVVPISEKKDLKKLTITEKKIKIYNKIRNDFLLELDKKTELFVFLNARPHIFDPDSTENSKKEFLVDNFFKKNWKYNTVLHDPLLFTKKKLKKIDKFNFPFLSMNCDAHYSSLGADIYSEFITKTFLSKIEK
jgi:hypothetical protein